MEHGVLAVVGGGAAGLAAAVAASEYLARARRFHAQPGMSDAEVREGELRARAAEGVRVALFEADERVGRSILATGNGRCNFSNARIDAHLYRNAKFVRDALQSFEAAARVHIPSQRKRAMAYESGVLGFFADHGLMWREEGEGRLYPLPNKATAVLDVLRGAADALGVEVRTGARVKAIEPPHGVGSPFTLRMEGGALERAGAVIVACGGHVARTLLPERLAFKEQQPVLGPLATDTHLVRQLDNIRVKGALELHRAGKLIAREEGEVMFRKYGISGIAAFNLSRLAKPGDELAVDFIPWVRLVDLPAFLNGRRKKMAAVYGATLTCGDFLNGVVLGQVAHVLLGHMGLSEGAPYERAHAERLAAALKGESLRFAVQGIGDAKQCQVQRGGFAVTGFDARTCEAREVAGLYVVGEALDVDAPCGGYNLHWAWASGLLAGWSAAGAATAVCEGGAREGSFAPCATKDAEGASAR